MKEVSVKDYKIELEILKAAVGSFARMAAIWILPSKESVPGCMAVIRSGTPFAIQLDLL